MPKELLNMWQTVSRKLLKKRSCLLLLGVALLWQLAACKQQRHQNEGTTMAWDTISYHQETPLDSQDPTLGAIEQDYTLLLPQGHSLFKQEICRVVLGSVKEDLDPLELLDSLARVNRGHDVQREGIQVPYQERLATSIAYEDSQLVSLAVEYQFSGEESKAHAFLCYYNFYLPEGKAFSESSLFVDGYEQPIAKLLTHKVETLAEGEIINYDEIRPNGNFMVSAEGVTYCFPEHAILVNHKGELSVSLSWEELRSLLKEKSPISHLVV